VLEICKENKIKFVEDYIKVNNLKKFDESFITGTITEVTPIIQIDDWIVGDGKPEA